MLVWLRNLFARPRLPPPPPAPVRAVQLVEEPAEELVLAATQSSCPPERIAEAVAMVRADFQEHQPGPESFPRNASRILEVIQHREPDFNKLVHVVGQDLAMAARLLQVANSAAFGHGNEVGLRLAESAGRRLTQLRYTNVHVRHGDGSLGWPDHAPYDAIAVTADPRGELQHRRQQRPVFKRIMLFERDL